MNRPRPARKPRPPLDPAALQDMALHYVARFATSRGKLVRYLQRKLRERDWAGPVQPEQAIDTIVERIMELGYVDDAAFAVSRARAFAARGLGPRRLSADLAAAGIGEEERGDAGRAMDEGAAALRFAEKKRIGPFALSPPDPRQKEKQFGAMLRAGHSMDLTRAILRCAPGETPDFS